MRFKVGDSTLCHITEGLTDTQQPSLFKIALQLQASIALASATIPPLGLLEPLFMDYASPK